MNRGSSWNSFSLAMARVKIVPQLIAEHHKAADLHYVTIIIMAIIEYVSKGEGIHDSWHSKQSH